MPTLSPSRSARIATALSALGIVALAVLGTFVACSTLLERALAEQAGRVRADIHRGSMEP